MLSPSHFAPGTILWLPKQADIDPLHALSAYHTVPERCFGHSVLVLADDETATNCAIILIVSTASRLYPVSEAFGEPVLNIL